MTLKQQNYKANRLAGMNIVNAARAAKYSESFAKSKAYRLERLVKVGMADAFEQAGFTDKAIVAYALEGMKALKLQSCNIFISKPNPESVDADKLVINKNSNDFIEVEDWNARHKFFETFLKMTDKLKVDPLIDNSTHHHLTKIYLPEQSPDGIKKIESRTNGLATAT